MVVLTIEILFNIAEATSLWTEDKCMSMFYPILREKKTAFQSIRLSHSPTTDILKFKFDDGFST